MTRASWALILLPLVAACGNSTPSGESSPAATGTGAPASGPAPSTALPTTDAPADPTSTSVAPTTTTLPADAPVPAAVTAFRLPDGFQYPENLAFDPSTGRVYVSSPMSGGAVAMAEPGADTASIWLPAGTDGMGGALGIEFGHGSIWLVTSGGVWEYGPDGVRRSVHLAPGGAPNDVAVTGDGVYATDEARSVLWYLPIDAPDGADMEPIDVGVLTAEAAGQGFNGIEALPDDTLIVGQFVCCSLFHVDPSVPSAVVVDLGGYPYLVGDGMSLDGDDLWLVHGSWMDSVDRIRLCPSHDCGTVVGGAVDPNLSFPTDVQVVDGAVLVVNSQFDNGSGFGADTGTLPFQVMPGGDTVEVPSGVSDDAPTLPFWVSAIPLP
jgi:hypothetical protein